MINKSEQLGMVASKDENPMEKLVDKFKYWKILRVTAYIKQFINNCKTSCRQEGPLTTEKIIDAETYWIRFITTINHLHH